MKILIMISSIILIISVVVMTLASILSKKTFMDREKNSPFECGFDPMSSSRIPFSLHFFLVTIIFLIFDVEIVLLMPLIVILKTSNLMIWCLTSSTFIFILLVGLYYEWSQGALNWTN